MSRVTLVVLLGLMGCRGAPKTVGQGCDVLAAAICKRFIQCGIGPTSDQGECEESFNRGCCTTTCQRDLRYPDAVLDCEDATLRESCSGLSTPPSVCNGALLSEP